MKRILPVLLVILLALGVWTLWGNTALMVSRYCVESDTTPTAFDGFRIAQVSDLHNAEFGTGNEALLALLKEESPDIIVLTGDLVDSRRTDIEIAAVFAARCAELAPTYFVTGNHEARLPGEEYAQLEQRLTDCGVVVLRNELVPLERDGESIALLGLDDPAFGALPTHLMKKTAAEFDYSILLAHHPELFDSYAACGVDLTFSGHAHGGQFRLPFVGGLIAPGQGLFPAYDAGVYVQKESHMVVSRGLGNSLFPFRFNNRPELVVVTLNAAKA